MKPISYFYGLWVILFSLFAYWQFNDPDPEVWVSIYTVAIIFSLFAIRGVFPKLPLTIVVASCVVGAIYFFPGGVGEWVTAEWAQKKFNYENSTDGRKPRNLRFAHHCTCFESSAIQSLEKKLISIQ